MSTLWADMGVMRWPLAFSLLAVVAFTATAGMRLFKGDASADLRTKAWLDAILFWGGFAMVAGLLGTLVGVAIAADFLEASGGGSPSLVWGGIKVALTTSIFGFFILAVGSLAWFVLQMRWRLLLARETEPRRARTHPPGPPVRRRPLSGVPGWSAGGGRGRPTEGLCAGPRRPERS